MPFWVPEHERSELFATILLLEEARKEQVLAQREGRNSRLMWLSRTREAV